MLHSARLSRENAARATRERSCAAFCRLRAAWRAPPARRARTSESLVPSPHRLVRLCLPALPPLVDRGHRHLVHPGGERGGVVGLRQRLAGHLDLEALAEGLPPVRGLPDEQ